MTSSDSQIDKPQRGRPKRAELPDININTGAQSINTEWALLKGWQIEYSLNPFHDFYYKWGKGVRKCENWPKLIHEKLNKI